MHPSDPEKTLAAIDLGSNSFHMVLARLDRGQLQVVDRIREHVRLAEGLGAGKRIDDDARFRALGCLQRFGERVADLPPRNVRVVGTNTLRKAKNARGFMKAARKVLGHEIEVVSGREEARLIYLGVAHSVDQVEEARRLVVDIGGGSTELIVGERFEPMGRDSVQMGCISYRRKHFADERLDDASFRRATVAARLEMRSLEQKYRRAGWDRCIGASGTIKSVDAVLRANRWSVGGITPDGLLRLRGAMVEAGTVSALRLPGLSDQRRLTLASGVAILLALFQSLKVEEMTVSGGALREGVLYELLGRIRREDVRERTIRTFQRRYSVDVDFASRVEETALDLLEQGHEAWGIDLEEGRRFVRWAAALHEIGLSVSHSGHHRHAAYLVRNSDMPGFSREDQEMLSAIVFGHRRRVTQERLAAYVTPDRVEDALRLCMFLRLAHRLHRVRRARVMPEVSITIDDTELRLGLPAQWLEEHPLSKADLEDEAWVLRGTGYELTVG